MEQRIHSWLPMPWVFRFCAFIASYEMFVRLKLIELQRADDDVDTNV